MADAVFVDRETGLKVTWVDQGDGTWAPRVAATGGGGGGGGGGAVTVADGANVALGARNASAASDDTGTFSLVALVKRLLQRITTLLDRTPALGRAAASASVPQVLATEDAATLQSIAGLSIPAHDYVGLTYTGDNLTGVVYKTGGSGGTTVGTLTLAYSGAVLTSVTKS